jgi:translation elongation factor EF-Ts
MRQGFAPSRVERETWRFLQERRLRQATGATRSECARALIECRFDIDKAIEWLRRKGTA